MANLLMQQMMKGVTAQLQPVAEVAKRPNPFLASSEQSMGANPFTKSEVGVNQPLKSPLFVGYKDNKAIYAGSRLFVLY